MQYWRSNPWRRNPPLKDVQGHSLTEHQVRLIAKYLDEINKGWHTREWFMDLLRMREDPQVVRYILKNVKWGLSSSRGEVPAIIQSRIDQYLDELDQDRFPDIPLDIPLIDSLIETRNQFPLFIEGKIRQLETSLFNLRLAERLHESRKSINALKMAVKKRQNEVEDILARINQEESETAEDAVVASPIMQEILSCDRCGKETFEWLEPEERADVMDISDNGIISTLQHQLRHAVIEYRNAAMSHRAKTYLFGIEDDIEEIHQKIEKLRNSSLRENRYRFNPFY